MNISINAPSFKRGDVKLSTLSLIPSCKIWVDENEAEQYRGMNKDAKVIACKSGIQGNLCRIRNHILREEFKAGADVVLIVDDDLKSIDRFEKAKESASGIDRYKLESADVYEFVEKYSRMAQELGAKFWGLNCISDPMGYRHSVPFSTRAYIGGPFQCFLKGNRCFYDERLPLKEDYDMTLQQLNKERVVLRVNKYHYYCKQSTNKGGCADYRNREREREQIEALQQKWGKKIVKIDKSNKGKTSKNKPDDYNPIIRIPIRGV